MFRVFLAQLHFMRPKVVSLCVRSMQKLMRGPIRVYESKGKTLREILILTIQKRRLIGRLGF